MPPQHQRVAKQTRPLLSEGLVLGALLIIIVSSVPLVFRSAQTSSPAASSEPSQFQAGSQTTPSTSAPGVLPTERHAPIVQGLLAFVPIVTAVARVALQVLSVLVIPFAATFHGIMVLLHPLVLVVNATVYVFILVPWGVVSAIGRVVYPIYTFGTAALLVGAFAGLLAKATSSLVISAFTPTAPLPARGPQRRKKLA